MRTIIINLDQDQLDRLIDHVGINNFSEALSRLTLWGYHAFNRVDIHSDWHDPIDLVAHYTTDNSESSFTLGAVFQEATGKYSFHS